MFHACAGARCRRNTTVALPHGRTPPTCVSTDPNKPSELASRNTFSSTKKLFLIHEQWIPFYVIVYCSKDAQGPT